jgi:hypothetical protein
MGSLSSCSSEQVWTVLLEEDEVALPVLEPLDLDLWVLDFLPFFFFWFFGDFLLCFFFSFFFLPCFLSCVFLQVGTGLLLF